MSKRFVFGVVAAVLAVIVLGGIIVWATGGGATRTAALEQSSSSNEVSWYVYGGTTAQSFWGDLRSVSGCDTAGDVATVKALGTGEIKKHLSGLSPSPCRLEVVVSERVNRDLYTWLNATLSQTYTRRNLTLVRKLSTSNQIRESISLRDALIERIELPALRSQAEGFTVGLTVRPEESTRSSNSPVANPPSGRSTEASTSHFDVALSGIGSLRPSRFEPWSAAVTIARAQPSPEERVGQDAYEANGLSVGDLGLSISLQTPGGMSRADNLHNWFNSFAIQGNADDGQERTLTVTLVDPRDVTAPPLLTVTFTNVGIFGEPSYWVANDPEKFLFYAEGASFSGLPSTTPPPPPPPPPATAAPPAPTNLQAAVEGSAINLSWEQVKEAAGGYRVLYAAQPEGPYKQLRETLEPAVTVELPAGTYYFVVRAVSGETESENSNEVSVEVAG